MPHLTDELGRTFCARSLAVVVIAVLLTASSAQPNPDDDVTVHVASHRFTSPADGSSANPFRSLQDAKEYVIRQHHTHSNASGVRRVLIHAGHYLPVAIDHPALSGIEWRGAGQNATIISGVRSLSLLPGSLCCPSHC